MMTVREIENALRLAFDELVMVAPRDTGNLFRNALKLERVEEGVWRLYVDQDVAPYMKYTNENWNEFAPPLKGKKNPNESWWNDEIKEFMWRVATILNAKNTEDFINL